MPNRNSATNSRTSEVKGKADDRERGGADLDELDALRDPGLVVAVGEFAAEAGEKEERSDERRAGKRDQGARIRRRRAGPE